MNKAILILQREYLTRVKKKSFILTTLLVPLAFAALIGFSTWMSLKGAQELQRVAVFDETAQFLNRIEGNDLLHITYIPQEKYQELRAANHTGDFNALVHVPHNVFTSNRIQIFSNGQAARSIQSNIKRQLESLITADKRAAVFDAAGIPDLEQKLARTTTRLQLDTIKLNEDGTTDKVSSEINSLIGMMAGFIIYIMIFMYGSMVMRGVAEEKTNRISEVLVSSVKPVQLLFGKIVGIGLVGLTQFLIWIIFGGILISASTSFFMPDPTPMVEASQSIMSSPGIPQSASMMSSASENEILSLINSLNLPLLLSSFLLFFVFGYLLYASIMGAIGSAVNTDEDAQQLVSIIAIPLVMAIVMVTPISENPNGTLAFWTSLFPLFSPVSMIARIPAGVAPWEILLSLALLIATTLVCVWGAAKIYRTGILMYGKKVSFKEIGKWIKRNR
ncbi:MAG: ABC transporter permease [Mangrovibacterium sp.]